MTRPVHRPEDANGEEPEVPKKRRSLSDGPAVRRALAQAESEAKSNAGWKLLEAPLDASNVSEVSGLLKTADDTQPEPGWKVVAVVDRPMPPNTDDPAPTSKAAPAQGTSPAQGTAPARQTTPAQRPTPARGTAVAQGSSPFRRPTPAQGTAAAAGIPRPTGARPLGATVPALDTATRARASTAATPTLAATQKSVAPLASTAVIPRPARRQTPPAVERTTPVPKPRSMMATQLGVAPPPPTALPSVPARPDAVPAVLAVTELDAMPSTVRVDPALAATQLDAMPSTVRVDRKLAQATPNVSPPSHAAAAFADTQLAAPRPPEVAALLDALDDDAPTVVQVPEFMLEATPPAQAASALPQAPLTTRSPDLATQPAAAQLQVAAPISGSSEGSRAALSSEAFATTQDTVPPLPMSRPALRLPSPFDRWSRPQLIGVGCAALVAASLPLFAVGALLTSRASVNHQPAAARGATTPPGANAAPIAKTAPATATPPPAANTAPGANAPPVTSASPGANAPPAATAPPGANATPVTSASATPPAPQASPKAAQTPPSAQASAVPWLDRPSTSTPSCDSLASARPGPKGFLLQQAIKQGQRELIRGNVKAAHAAFCEAVALGYPTDVVLIGLAQVLLMQSDANAALKTVEQLLTLRPNDRQALDLRGDILIRLGRADEARQTWYRAAGASRESASLIENLRRVNRADAARALKAGDLARADRLWRRVIALDVRDVAGCAELAAVLAKNGELDAARRWLAYADTLDPAHPRLVAVKSSLGS